MPTDLDRDNGGCLALMLLLLAAFACVLALGIAIGAVML